MNSQVNSDPDIKLVDWTTGITEKSPLMCIYPVTTIMGEVWIGLHGGKVVWLSFGEPVKADLQAYWKGPVKTCTDCPVSARTIEAAASGRGYIEVMPIGTTFQIKVWKELLRIPFSDTCTYGQVAKSMGSPRNARAVGSAVGANPIAWLIPCHRVLPVSGQPGNYRWGRHMKAQLLNWECSGLEHDEASRRKMESMLINARRFEDISKMAGDIAHDLNNLLAPIRMATELLKTKLSDRSLDRYVEIIETSTGRARSVVQEILAFSRETDGANRQKLKVTPILKELEKIVRNTFPERLSIEFTYHDNPPHVQMDPTQLHRAVLNILVNARDAIQDTGTISVRVSIHDLDMRVRVGEMSFRPGRFVCISVSDTGTGVPEEIRERIFDPFFTTKPKEQGTGLGLASVYGIIARTGGFIDLESEEGSGTTFHLYIPEVTA